MPSDRFRQNVKTPLKLRDTLPASRPRLQGVMSQPPPAPSNVPAAVVQPPRRGGAPRAGPSAPAPAPAASAVNTGSPSVFSTTWWNLSSTMKLVLVHQVGEEIGGETVEAQNRAMRYLEMSNDEMHDLCDLDEREYARAVQFNSDTTAYEDYLLGIPLHATELTPNQRQQLADIEKKRMDNMKVEAPAGALVRSEDVQYAQRLVQERAPDDTPLRRAILSGLERHMGQDYVKEPISAFLRPTPDSDDE